VDPKNKTKKREKTYLLTLSTADSRRNGETLSMANWIIP